MALPVFYPIFGGGPLRFLGYQKGLRERGVEALILTGTPRAKDELHGSHGTHSSTEPVTALASDDWQSIPIGTLLPIEEIEGVPVHRVRLPSRSSIRRTSAYFRALLDLCRDPETRPDVIQLHSFERVEALYWIWRLRRLGIPILYVVQIAQRPVAGSKIAGLLKAALRHTFYNSFDGIVTSSETIAASMRAIGIGTPIEVIPNGVDLKRYSPRDKVTSAGLRVSLGISGRGPVLLSVGAVSARKGTHLLVDSWLRLLRRWPDLELVLVGPTAGIDSAHPAEFAKRLKERIDRSGCADQVHVLGVRDDVAVLYSIADALVLPTSREGGTPNVVLEGMASRCPVVLTPFLGQSIAIGRPGIEFEHADRDVDGVERAIANVLDDAARRRELASRGEEWITRTLDQEDTLDHFERVYRTIARAGKKREGRLNDAYPTPICGGVTVATGTSSARRERDVGL